VVRALDADRRRAHRARADGRRDARGVRTRPTFTVADIEAAKAHLESVGAVFDGDIHEVEGMVKLASFKDPDGNALGLAERI
jgi:predicted enzyme related to lactoylglutathione lyase